MSTQAYYVWAVVGRHVAKKVEGKGNSIQGKMVRHTGRQRHAKRAMLERQTWTSISTQPAATVRGWD